MNNGIKAVQVHSDKWEEYLLKGYVFGQIKDDKYKNRVPWNKKKEDK